MTVNWLGHLNPQNLTCTCIDVRFIICDMQYQRAHAQPGPRRFQLRYADRLSRQLLPRDLLVPLARNGARYRFHLLSLPGRSGHPE